MMPALLISTFSAGKRFAASAAKARILAGSAASSVSACIPRIGGGGFIERLLTPSRDDDVVSESVKGFGKSAADARAPACDQDGVARGLHDVISVRSGASRRHLRATCGMTSSTFSEPSIPGGGFRPRIFTINGKTFTFSKGLSSTPGLYVRPGGVKDRLHGLERGGIEAVRAPRGIRPRGSTAFGPLPRRADAERRSFFDANDEIAAAWVVGEMPRGGSLLAPIDFELWALALERRIHLLGGLGIRRIDKRYRAFGDDAHFAEVRELAQVDGAYGGLHAVIGDHDQVDRQRQRLDACPQIADQLIDAMHGRFVSGESGPVR